MNESGRETKRRRKEEVRDSKDDGDDVGLTLTEIAKIGNTYGHPYGVQLLGNRFASETDTLPCSLGACFDRLGDVKMLQFLDTYLEDAKMLGKLAMVNRAFYVLSRTCLFSVCLFFDDTRTLTPHTGTDIDAPWKRIVLLKFGGHFRFKNASWRETFIHMTTKQHDIEHRPLRIENFYSDLIFRPYLCATMDMRESWLRVDNVIRRSNLSRDDFIKDFETPNVPVVLTGAAKDWPAYQKWTHQYLTKVSGNKTFNCGGFQVTFENYVQYATSNKPFEDQPLYLFAKHFCDKIPSLEKDYDPPSLFGEDLFSLLGTLQKKK